MQGTKYLRSGLYGFYCGCRSYYYLVVCFSMMSVYSVYFILWKTMNCCQYWTRIALHCKVLYDSILKAGLLLAMKLLLFQLFYVYFTFLKHITRTRGNLEFWLIILLHKVTMMRILHHYFIRIFAHDFFFCFQIQHEMMTHYIF